MHKSIHISPVSYSGYKSCDFRYSQVFLGLGSALIKKVQFSYNFSQLVDVNRVDVDDDVSLYSYDNLNDQMLKF